MLAATLLIALVCAQSACVRQAASPRQGPPSAALPTAPTPPAATPDDRLDGVASWAFAIGDAAVDGTPAQVASRLGMFDLVVVDGEEATVEQIAALRAGSTLVLGYLSVGTIEPWRGWYELASPYRLETMEPWGEYYADLGAPGYRDLIASEVAPMLLDKGFDGLFLDNLDMAETHPQAIRGMRTLLETLSASTRSHGALLFAQNGGALFDDAMWRLLDGWNREDVTWTYDFDAGSYLRVGPADHAQALSEIARIRALGLLVLTTDYTRDASGPDEADAVATSVAAGALPYVSDIELTRLPSVPLGLP